MTRVFEVFYQFLILGCISFGGPAAHIGYFQTTFVQKLSWLDQQAYVKLVALSQFLPGPGSSQVGFAIGLRRAGLAGGLAAFIGFTLPSFFLLYLLAIFALDSRDSIMINGVIQGLKQLAVIVVADASLSMFKSFCKDKLSITLMVISTLCFLVFPSLWIQMAVLALAALAGILLSRSSDKSQSTLTMLGIKRFPLIAFSVLFVGLPFINAELFASFYQAGSLVFGGGHVVLPLLQQTVGEQISNDQFLTGYAAAQAVPGPMFTLATYLGATLLPAEPLTGALLATFGIFLPGFLLIYGLQNTWETLTQNPKVAGGAAAINAAVVGLLVSALYNPVFVSAVTQPLDLIIVVFGFLALRIKKLPMTALVVVMSAIGVLLY
ncbi:MAG: chromate efflux transporter [Gammaproteobacteria bacterium]|nr:chromate efflux transporter [Gammaproteobacteria bacterium]